MEKQLTDHPAGTDSAPPGALAAEPPEQANCLDRLLEEASDHLQLQMLLIETAAGNEQADLGLIARAYHFAAARHTGQTRKSGEPFMQHCVEVARILAQMRLDSTTVAAVLYTTCWKIPPSPSRRSAWNSAPRSPASLMGSPR